MVKRDTKQVILDEALELFSTKGYDGVTVADIADAVGIKAASLYKHYKSKQDIFDSILVVATEKYKEMATQLGIDGNAHENDIDKFSNMDLNTLIQTGTMLFLYFLHDSHTKKLRRVLTIEQYKNPAAAKLLTIQYNDAPLQYQSALFQAFINMGKMKHTNANIAAVQFYSPIYLMLCMCDNYPEKESEALDYIKQHITQFDAVYMKEM